MTTKKIRMMPVLRKETMFNAGQYKQFRKGDLYRDPRITRELGKADFIVLDNAEDDFLWFERYLKNEHQNYPSEEYNMFTTGVDKNNTPMIAMYWVNEDMDQIKKAIVLCRGGCENDVLAIVDEYCMDAGEVREWEAQEATQGGNTLHLPSSLAKYKTN